MDTTYRAGTAGRHALLIPSPWSRTRSVTCWPSRWRNPRCKFGFFRTVITRSRSWRMCGSLRQQKRAPPKHASQRSASVGAHRLKRNLAGHTADHNSLPRDPSVRFDRHAAGQATVLVQHLLIVHVHESQEERNEPKRCESWMNSKSK